ncbi:MAG TPA: ABC-F family ATP-binding cassette domain-containing protein [Bacteroidota bacterium]|nr:ABC-F family ATP-binding cassette domain-containing protein [Bacteroidota bacterium]
MISIDRLTMQYGGRTLFAGFSHVIGPHDRIGLVGANGSGKTTLLRLLAGLTEPESGTITRARYVTVGYLPQEIVLTSGKPLYDEAALAFDTILDIEAQLEETRQKLSSFDPADPEHSELLEIAGELQHKLEDLDAFRMKSKIERVLMGLGFSTADFRRPTDEFSGGWQMRIALAKILLREPSLILLDEPTNHLDLESLQWLEEYLAAYNGAVVLVSHDRAFLDKLAKTTIALANASLDVYAGNYSFYEKESELRRTQAEQALKQQQKEIRRTQEFIDRFRYKATKARQVQSRIKMLEKMDQIELPDQEEEVRFHFPRPKPSGAVVMELRRVSKRYGEKTIFTDLSLVIERGDRIAVVGVNGAGKSTCARILAGIEPFEAGERITGHNTVTAYFAQHQAEELDLSKEVLQTLDDIATGEIRAKLRTLLGSFLFHGDDVFKSVKILSGGEKSRLALAKMLLQPANFLIMDEPTNHLDMRSKTVLQQALGEYGGTFMIVSHDRAFLDPIVTRVFEFSPGKLSIFPGNVSEYLERKESLTSDPARDIPSGRPGAATEKERKRQEAERRQLLSRQLKPLRKELDALEKNIAADEARVRDLQTAMADPDFYKMGEEAKTTSREYHALRSRLEGYYERWAELSEAIEEIRRSSA